MLRKEVGMTICYFGLHVSSIHRIKKDLRGCLSVFAEAPNKAALLGAVGRVINEGNCAKNTDVNEINIGVEAEFIAGDLIRFRGTPIKEVQIDSDIYLKIEVKKGAKNVFIYSYRHRRKNKYVSLQKC